MIFLTSILSSTLITYIAMGAKPSEQRKKGKSKELSSKLDAVNEMTANVFSNQYELSK